MTSEFLLYGTGDTISYTRPSLISQPASTKIQIIYRTHYRNPSETPNLSNPPFSASSSVTIKTTKSSPLLHCSSNDRLHHTTLLHCSSNDRLHHRSSRDPLRRERFRNSTTQLDAKASINQRLNFVIQKLNLDGSSPLKVFQDDGNWDKDLFWAVINFLKQKCMFEEIIQVFNVWKTLEESRINEVNYCKVLSILTEAGRMEEAVSLLRDMKTHGMDCSSDIYNSVIHGYANQGKFDDALVYLKEMEDGSSHRADTVTYDGLIHAYGKFLKYDEMINCLKIMERSGCPPDHLTYNLLIQELARGGLLNRMERMCQTVMSKRMQLQSSTLVAVIEAYAKFGVLEKMEKFYGKFFNSRNALRENMVRNIAMVYLENYMFSRLSALGDDLSSRVGRTDLVWCLYLLFHACSLSKKGMDTIIFEMEESKVPWNATVVNILLLAYLKLKDFKHFTAVLLELPARRVEPDLVTFGILFDAQVSGFDWSRTLQSWKRFGYLNKTVEFNTDPLVLTAFGKGNFLRVVEDMYSLDPQARKQKRWNYQSIIHFVEKWKDKFLQLQDGKVN